MNLDAESAGGAAPRRSAAGGRATPSGARERLARTPAPLDGWPRGLPEPWLPATEGEGAGSPRDVVAHLLDNEEVNWLPRLRLVREHGEARPFTPLARERGSA